jgi:TIR domain-containing protein
VARAAVYQILVFGPAALAHAPRLRRTMCADARSLGLGARHLHFLRADQYSSHDDRWPLVAVYFGERGRVRSAEEALATQLRRDGVFVLPAVPTLVAFAAQVPAELRAINGLRLRAEDPDLHGVAARLLEEMGLVRRRRVAFISYKRAESRRAALQLHAALTARSWEVFLDTHSLAAGVDFQPGLWDRMNDADLLVLLNSPTAMSSKYVKEEVARAHNLGLGVLQVSWPGRNAAPGTELCEPLQLDAGELCSGRPGQRGGVSLRQRAVGRIITAVEGVRSRVWAARHARMVKAFCDRATALGVRTALQHDGFIEVGARGLPRQVQAVVGHPSAQDAHQADTRSKRYPHRPVLLFDPSGMLDSRLQHLQWLNRHLPVKAVALHEIDRWIRSI